MTTGLGSRLRWIVAVCAADGQVASVHACEDAGSAMALRRLLEPSWPGYTVHVCRPGWVLAVQLDDLADKLAARAVAGGDQGLTTDELARRDGIAAAAVVIRERANAIRRWAP